MYCKKCGSSIERKSRYCAGCGRRTGKMYKRVLITFVAVAMVAFVGIGAFLIYDLDASENRQAMDIQQANKKITHKSEAKVGNRRDKEKSLGVEPVKKVGLPKEISQIIEEAQPKVFTIFTQSGQGSGFLMNRHGDILTNAHVVEGSVDVTVHNHEGKEFNGTVIGYSNQVDIAVVRINQLDGQAPLSLEANNAAKLGDEVIALGSPKGYENTATLGNVSGVDRSFIIPPHTYDGIYQISAPIAPGSSGGPLIDRKKEKVIAINSARDNSETNIAFSIPIYNVLDMINGWANSPMGPDEIRDLFYDDSGLYYYQDLYSDDFYFEGGEYNDEFDDDDYESPSRQDEKDDDLQWDEEDDYYLEDDDDEENWLGDDDTWDSDDNRYDDESDDGDLEQKEEDDDGEDIPGDTPDTPTDEDLGDE